MNVFAAVSPQFPSMAIKTYASQRVWRNSSRSEIKFSPLDRRSASKLWHDARRFERQTMHTRIDAFGKRHHQGRLGRMGLMVLHTLIYDFLNFKSGRLDPSYQAIAHKACISVRSVARGLAKLRDAGVLNWVRRCTGSMDGDRYVLDQDTNAYGIAAPGCWRGYRPAPEPPPPDPASWGAAPPLPSAIGLAAAELAAGGIAAAMRHLESDPGDALAAALGKLGRRRGIS